MPLEPQRLAAFLVAARVLIATPGPDMLFVIGRSLAGGARRGWAAMSGIVTGRWRVSRRPSPAWRRCGAAGLIFVGLGPRLLVGGRPG